MLGKVIKILREYVFVLSILTMIFGFFLLLIGVLWILFSNMVVENDSLQFIEDVANWNYYVFVIGVIIFSFGVYYLYSFLKNKKFVLDEIKTNRISEFMKMHNELKSVVRRLPSKYEKMLKDKEMELKIK